MKTTIIEDYFPNPNSFKEIIKGSGYSTNDHLTDLDRLDRLISDWLRYRKNIICSLNAGDKTVEQICKDKGINIPSALEKVDETVREKFKQVLREFIPIDLELNNKAFGKLASIFHQDGIISRMENHIIDILDDRKLVFDTQKNITRRIILTPTETGGTVENTYVCGANVVNLDDVEILAHKEDRGNLLTAKCEQTFSFDAAGNISVEVQSAEIYSHDKTLIQCMCSQTKQEMSSARAGSVGSFGVSSGDDEMASMDPSSGDDERTDSASFDPESAPASRRLS
jgi:hypothetical protein